MGIQATGGRGATKPLKQRVIEELDQLPEDRLREVLDFVGYLKLKEERETPPRKLDPEKDPILKLIGSVDVEPFAHRHVRAVRTGQDAALAVAGQAADLVHRFEFCDRHGRARHHPSAE